MRASGFSAAPQPPQKSSPGSFLVPHDAQDASSRLPHFAARPVRVAAGRTADGVRRIDELRLACPPRWPSRSRYCGPWRFTVAERPYVSFVLPETRYARSGDVSIAYQVIGRDRATWCSSRGSSPTSSSSTSCRATATSSTPWRSRASSFSTSVAMDFRIVLPAPRPRGTDGRHPRRDGGGRQRAGVALRRFRGWAASLLFAATFPERVEAIVLYETFVRFGGPADYRSVPRATCTAT